MKLRFLAAFGDADALARLSSRIGPPGSAGLEQVVRRPGLSAWIVVGTPWSLVGPNEDLLIGLTFSESGNERVGTEDPATGGRPLFGPETWGIYACFRQQGRRHSVQCDPSGTIPVYHGFAEDVHFYASDAAMLGQAWLAPMRPSMDYLRHWLTFPFFRGARTGVEGITELVPGCTQYVGETGVRIEQTWSPVDHVDATWSPLDLDEAARRLRAQILRTVSRIAAVGDDIALLLSGGLDSSILAAALATSGYRFRAITFATRAPDGDERRFARLVADHTGAELIELVEPEWTPDFELAASSPFRPPGNPMLEPFRRAVALDLSINGTGILMDGAGGDNVFGQASSSAPVRDALRHAGPVAGIRAARNLAELHGTTFWSVSRAAFHASSLSRGKPWSPDLRFLSLEAAFPAADDHPWLRRLPRGLPGKADQIRMIAGIRHFLPDPDTSSPAAIHPLLTQPILELCLSIPTWLSIQGGRDRAVARRAFRNMLPESVLARRGKGRLESLFLTGFMRSRAKLETFLLDGRLSASGLLDKEAVRACLGRPPVGGDHDYLRLLEIAAAEQWLRSFGG